MGENRDLAVLCAGERCLVTLKAQLGYIQTGTFACFLKNQLGRLRVFVQIPAHAGACAPWPGKNAKPYSTFRSSKIIIKR